MVDPGLFTPVSTSQCPWAQRNNKKYYHTTMEI